MKGTSQVKSTKKYASIIFVIGVATLWFNSPAYAYINPGIGSILLQMLLGGLVGLAIVLKLYWAQVKKVFQNPFSKKRGHGNEDK
jgi:cell division protein FtsW (lipid II flippase)